MLRSLSKKHSKALKTRSATYFTLVKKHAIYHRAMNAFQLDKYFFNFNSEMLVTCIDTLQIMRGRNILM